MSKLPSDYYAPSVRGCISGLVSLAAFCGGIYRGICHANGTLVDSNLENVLIFGPITASIPISINLGNQVINDPRVDLFSDSDKDTEGCEKGCGIGCGIIGGMGAMALSHGVGYLIGNFLGHHI